LDDMVSYDHCGKYVPGSAGISRYQPADTG
jgi:hypothetical protein